MAASVESDQTQESGLSLEARLGMCVVVILVCAFGFLVYRKFDMRQQQLLQVTGGSSESESTEETGEMSSGTRLASFEKQEPLEPSVNLELSATTIDQNESHTHEPAIDFGEAIASLDEPDGNQVEPVPQMDQFLNDTSVEQSIGTNATDDDIDPFAAFETTTETKQDLATAEASTSDNGDPFTTLDNQSESNELQTLFGDELSEPTQISDSGINGAEQNQAEVNNFFADVEQSNQVETSTTQVERPLTNTIGNEPVVADTQQTDVVFLNTDEQTESELTEGNLLSPVENNNITSETVAAFNDSSSLTIPANDQGEDVSNPFAEIDTNGSSGTPSLELTPVSDDTETLIAMIDDSDGNSSQIVNDSESLDGDPELIFESLETEDSIDKEFDSFLSDNGGGNTASSIEQSAPVPTIDVPDVSATGENGSLNSNNQQPETNDSQFTQDYNFQTAQSPVQVQQAISSNHGAAPSGQAFDLNGFNYENNVKQVSHVDDGCKVLEVQPNDNYWKISKRAYGSARYFSALALYNQNRISDPRKMRPGMKVLIPRPEVLEERYAKLFRDLQPKKSEPAGFFVSAQGSPAYRVGNSETLSEIAERHLGRSSRWVQIYRLNQQVLKDPNKLKPGVVLQLPEDATDIHLVP